MGTLYCRSEENNDRGPLPIFYFLILVKPTVVHILMMVFSKKNTNSMRKLL